MNYDHINDIFSAGVTNMTCLLQDSNSYDGGTLAVSGADFSRSSEKPCRTFMHTVILTGESAVMLRTLKWITVIPE